MALLLSGVAVVRGYSPVERMLRTGAIGDKANAPNGQEE
jgi:hypothetical protein